MRKTTTAALQQKYLQSVLTSRIRLVLLTQMQQCNNQEWIFRRFVQCDGGRRYSIVQTPSAKFSFIARGMFQMNLHSTRTIWMHAISPWIPKCIQCCMAYIHSNFGWIPHSIKKLETTELSLQKSMDSLENAEVKLSAVWGETSKKICRKF
jgi:hypothetical protein